jgi:hypothetical protein
MKPRTCLDCPADISHRHGATRRCTVCAEIQDAKVRLAARLEDASAHRHRYWQRKGAEKGKPKVEKTGRHCSACLGLSWRRPLSGCPKCCCAFQLEPVLKR